MFYLWSFLIRNQKLDDSLAFHQFRADADEEESWISERIALANSKDLGDTMAANQGLLKKQEAFEADLGFHKGQTEKVVASGKKLIAEVSASLQK